MENWNRRKFLATTLVGAASLPSLISRSHAAENAEPIKLGLIGAGWYGMVDVNAAFKVGGVELIALCDVDTEHLEKAAQEVEKLQGRRPKTFKQYEQLLATPGLQAVIIATPPQWHALPFIDALEKGLDIYCEKPLAYDIREGQAMATAAAKKPSQIVQIGFQRRQSPAFQQVRQFIQDGNLGELVQVEAQIHYNAGIKDTTPQAPPPSLDWDLWCGPAPKLPYCPQIGHMNWRLEKEYGHGHLVDWGIHLIDATRVILGERAPRTVAATGGIYRLKGKITTPDVLTAHFEFDACPVTWRHRIWGAAEYTPETSNGIFFYGDKATVFVTDDRWVVIPRERGKERETHEVNADTGKAHMAEFLKAVRTRTQPGCLTADAHLSTATVKLAMIAYDTGEKIVWDNAKQTIPGNSAARKLLKRDYRGPYRHPYRG